MKKIRMISRDGKRAIFRCFVGAALLTLSFALSADAAVVNPGDSSFTKIWTVDDLKKIADNLGGNYILMNDIDMSGEESWEALGKDADHPFTGVFDGNGYFISNFHISSEYQSNYIEYKGLFGYVKNAELRNIGLEDYEIKLVQEGTEECACYVGAIAAELDGARLENSFASGEMSVFGDGTVYVRAGGLIGVMLSGEIVNCYSSGKIYAGNGDYGNVIAGGIAGWADMESAVTYCYTTASVGAGAETDWSEKSASGAYNTLLSIYDNLEGNYGYAGGIVGSGDEFSISRCFALSQKLYATYAQAVVSNAGTLSGNYAREGMGSDESVMGELSAAQIARQSVYERIGWDYEDTWTFHGNLKLPELKIFIRRHWTEEDTAELLIDREQNSVMEETPELETE